MSSDADRAGLSPEQVEFFHREGYLIQEGFLDSAYSDRLIAEVDELMRHRGGNDHRLLVSYPEMGLLTSHPPMMDKLGVLIGPRYAMHHIHSTRFDTGASGVHWHQDYEQDPQTNRSHIMVHVFYYMNGLNGEIGDLLLVPRSQTIVVGRDLKLFGTEDLPGSICLNKLSAGSAVIVHSALWHGRRPKPGGEGRPRYFIDISYCQHGVLWPAYDSKKIGTTKQINRTALEKGLDRNGRYLYLYDSAQFFDRMKLKAGFDEINKGSVALKLKDLQ